MPTCSAYGCSYKSFCKEMSGKTVHRFPFSRPSIMRLWIKSIRRKNWLPSHGSVICSDHFKPECFDRNGKIVRLKKDAVPTIFNFPEHIKMEIRESERVVTPPCNLPIKEEPFDDISNDKNRILVVPEGMDVEATFSNSKGYSNANKNVVILEDEAVDFKTVLNCGNEEDTGNNRAIIVSDGTNVKTEWYGNALEEGCPTGGPTLYDLNFEVESYQSGVVDHSRIRALLSYDPEFYSRRVESLEEKMEELQKKVKVLKQTSRRRKIRIEKLQKEARRAKKNRLRSKCSTCPIIHTFRESSAADDSFFESSPADAFV